MRLFRRAKRPENRKRLKGRSHDGDQVTTLSFRQRLPTETEDGHVQLVLPMSYATAGCQEVEGRNDSESVNENWLDSSSWVNFSEAAISITNENASAKSANEEQLLYGLQAVDTTHRTSTPLQDTTLDMVNTSSNLQGPDSAASVQTEPTTTSKKVDTFLSHLSTKLIIPSGATEQELSDLIQIASMASLYRSRSNSSGESWGFQQSSSEESIKAAIGKLIDSDLYEPSDLASLSSQARSIMSAPSEEVTKWFMTMMNRRTDGGSLLSGFGESSNSDENSTSTTLTREMIEVDELLQALESTRKNAAAEKELTTACGREAETSVLEPKEKTIASETKLQKSPLNDVSQESVKRKLPRPSIDILPDSPLEAQQSPKSVKFSSENTEIHFHVSWEEVDWSMAARRARVEQRERDAVVAGVKWLSPDSRRPPTETVTAPLHKPSGESYFVDSSAPPFSDFATKVAFFESGSPSRDALVDESRQRSFHHTGPDACTEEIGELFSSFSSDIAQDSPPTAGAANAAEGAPPVRASAASSHRASKPRQDPTHSVSTIRDVSFRDRDHVLHVSTDEPTGEHVVRKDAPSKPSVDPPEEQPVEPTRRACLSSLTASSQRLSLADSCTISGNTAFKSVADSSVGGVASVPPVSPSTLTEASSPRSQSLRQQIRSRRFGHTVGHHGTLGAVPNEYSYEEIDSFLDSLQTGSSVLHQSNYDSSSHISSEQIISAPSLASTLRTTGDVNSEAGLLQGLRTNRANAQTKRVTHSRISDIPQQASIDDRVHASDGVRKYWKGISTVKGSGSFDSVSHVSSTRGITRKHQYYGENDLLPRDTYSAQSRLASEAAVTDATKPYGGPSSPRSPSHDNRHLSDTWLDGSGAQIDVQRKSSAQKAPAKKYARHQTPRNIPTSDVYHFYSRCSKRQDSHRGARPLTPLMTGSSLYTAASSDSEDDVTRKAEWCSWNNLWDDLLKFCGACG